MRNYKPTVTAVMTSQTDLTKGRCPQNTLTELAYVVAMTVRKLQKQKTQQIKKKSKPNQVVFNSKPIVYICILYILPRDFSKRTTFKAERPKRYLFTPTQSPHI